MDLPALRFADLDGPVAFRAWEGPPETTFVLVHGLGGAHVNWIRVAEGLAGLGRTVALDLPGFGWSPRAGRDTGVMGLRRIFDRFCDDHATGELVVCGNSMGGVLGILEAAIEPERVRGLVLTSSAFPWVRGAYPHPAVIGAFAAYDLERVGDVFVRERIRRISAERAVRIGLALTTVDRYTIPEEVVRLFEEAVRERQRDPEAATAFADAARSLLRLGKRPDVAHRALDAVGCPVLVLHGRRDRLVPARFAEAVLARYPTWRGRILPDVGHVAQLEAPGRWLAEVADWYAEAIDRG
jgi:pimeloyl-ACP methyl ester carboxylesterase